ncbi:MAG: M56 family metallopeptidase, partial [Bacteroidota bacterium]|nr:M56 family metallopeptidase [Bacteroidota bacterium]
VGLPGVVAVLLPAAEVTALGNANAAALDWGFWLRAVYLAGVGLLLTRLLLELGRLWWQARHLPRTTCPSYTLIETHGRLPTSSFGSLIFWDETLPLNPTEARQVLAHELAHVRQHHTTDRLLLELLRAALWFNPFVHLCARALALTHEYLADEAALHQSTTSLIPAHSTSYSQLLARQVASRLGFSVPLAHSFSHSQTLSRIAMIQKTKPISRWKQWLALPLLGVLLAAVACEKAAPPAEPAVSSAVQNSVAPPPPPTVIPRDGKKAPLVLKKVYVFVEEMPHLDGSTSNSAIVEAIQARLVYPSVAAADQRTGRIFASFIVTEHGDVIGARIVKGLSAAYDEAVVAAIRKMPKMVPGKQDGRAVAVSFTVPIQFAAATTAGVQ